MLGVQSARNRCFYFYIYLKISRCKIIQSRANIHKMYQRIAVTVGTIVGVRRENV